MLPFMNWSHIDQQNRHKNEHVTRTIFKKSSVGPINSNLCCMWPVEKEITPYHNFYYFLESNLKYLIRGEFFYTFYHILVVTKEYFLLPLLFCFQIEELKENELL